MFCGVGTLLAWIAGAIFFIADGGRQVTPPFPSFVIVYLLVPPPGGGA